METSLSPALNASEPVSQSEREAFDIAETAAYARIERTRAASPSRIQGKPNDAGYTGLLTSEQFAQSEPLVRRFLVDGIIETGRLYSLTGVTGSGKTAVLMRMAADVALGRCVCGHRTTKSRVVFLAGENPSDVHGRWLTMCADLGLSPKDIEVHFVRGAFDLTNLKDGLGALKADVMKLGKDFGAVIVDTSAAFFARTEHEDENSNVDMQQWALELRELLEAIPGKPAVIVASHPIKGSERRLDLDNLVPRGGGAFLNSIDGNMTATVDGTTGYTKIHWAGKFRGVPFDPLYYELKILDSPIKNERGIPIKSVVAEPKTDAQVDAKEATERQELESVLLKIAADRDGSVRDWCRAMGWVNGKGDPKTSTMFDRLKKLVALGWLHNDKKGSGYIVTNAGEAVVRRLKPEQA
jgi:hypothetical protein